MFAAADFSTKGYQVLRVTVMAGVSVKIENLAPASGGFLTPIWVGFHDGSFDVATLGEAVSPGLESLAEDGATGGLSQEFLGSGAGLVDGTIISDGDIPADRAGWDSSYDVPSRSNRRNEPLCKLCLDGHSQQRCLCGQS